MASHVLSCAPLSLLAAHAVARWDDDGTTMPTLLKKNLRWRAWSATLRTPQWVLDAASQLEQVLLIPVGSPAPWKKGGSSTWSHFVGRVRDANPNKADAPYEAWGDDLRRSHALHLDSE